MVSTIITDKNKNKIYVENIDLNITGIIIAYNKNNSIVGSVAKIKNQKLVFYGIDEEECFNDLFTLIENFPEYTFKYIE